MWIDTHAHLNDDCFDDTVAEVIDRAKLARVERILVIGIDVASSVKALELATRFEALSAVIGIQPNCLDEVRPDDWRRIEELSRQTKVVALGETGLDNYWKKAPLELQEDYFHRHLRLCNDLDLPVVIHCREAEADIVRCLEKHRAFTGKPIHGVMHSFTADPATVKQCIDLGLHISFAGMVTFKKNDALRTSAASVPLDRILVETDSPYLAPHPLRGKPNEPAYVIHTGECIAKVRGISVADFAAATTTNAKRLFRLS